jgi:Methyltransferase domain
MLDFGPYLRRPLATVAAVATDPIESWVRFREQYAAHREGITPPDLYKPDENWEVRLHSLVGLGASHQLSTEFYDLWPLVVAEMTAKGIRVGPESFKGWNDGDVGLVRAIWCLVRHLKPSNVVETGVAHGVTSRIVLEALARNQGSGRLWSIDRPPLEHEWKQHIGIAVPQAFRDRWTYILGSSRLRLPGLLRSLGQVDLFIHDSMHSARNVGFELRHVWDVLRPGGAVVVDDIDVNRGFHQFLRSFSNQSSLICEAEPLRPDTRRFNKKGLFGIAIKHQTMTQGLS